MQNLELTNNTNYQELKKKKNSHRKIFQLGYNKYMNHRQVLEQHLQGDFNEELLQNHDLEAQKYIQFLKDLRCYKGIRHSLLLPTRGQRTKRNAKTNRKKNK